MIVFGLLIPLALALLRLGTGRYLYSALTSLACAALILLGGAQGAWALVTGLLVSVAGDWLLAHPKVCDNAFIYGVACFGAGHILFALYASRRCAVSPWAIGVAALLAVAYGAYLFRCVLPGQPLPMKIALSDYTLVSLLGLFFALCLDAPLAERALYALGIACILFSDTMIAEAEFVGHARAQPLILPTYYLCHILIAASRLIK